MITVITGVSGSGKSEYAEQYAQMLAQNKKLFYVATMKPYGKEADRKIMRHRKLREGKGFLTLECYENVGDLQLSSEKEDSVILLECMSNLLANEMFCDQKQKDKKDDKSLVKKILQDIQLLEEKCSHLIVVTNEIFSDGADYDESTKDYIKSLGEINRGLVSMADYAAEIVYTVPVLLKDCLAHP